MVNKLKLLGTGNKENRFFYIFEKDKIFFSLFPKFLIGCDFENLGLYEDEDISFSENKVENFKNDFYDIDVIFTCNRVILIIRTDEREALISGILPIFS